MSTFNWRDCYISYLNLPLRKDRLAHIQKELSRVGISAVRTEGKYPHEYSRAEGRLQTQWKRTPGSIGCMMGQLKIMQDAYDKGKSAFVLEDDAVLATDIQKRLDYFQDFLNTQEDWSVGWLGSTFHKEPRWHAAGHPNPEITGHCNCSLNRDWEPTDDKKIIRTYGLWGTYAYIVRYEAIPEVIRLLEEKMWVSIGIDYSFILLQPQIKTFATIPGMAKQIDNQSDIGKGWTIFSGFSVLGEYWFQDLEDNFNYENFYK